MIFKGILILFALVAIRKTIRQYRAQKVSAHWFVVWSLFWIGVVAVALWPHVTDQVVAWAGVERGADLIVYLSIVFLFYAVYRMLERMERQRRELTDLVRQLAIHEAKKPEEK